MFSMASCQSGTMAGLPDMTLSTAAGPVFSTSGPIFSTPGPMFSIASCHSGTMAGLPGMTFSTPAGDFNMQKEQLQLELLRAQVGAIFSKINIKDHFLAASM
jgi:hypothetical protein